MSAPLQVPISVHPEAGPVLEFFRSHGHDLGTCKGSWVYHDAPDDMRLIVVNCTDMNAVWAMAAQMRVAFQGRPDLIELTSRVALIDGELDTKLVVFLDIMAIEVP
jgi:hypothetical protein